MEYFVLISCLIMLIHFYKLLLIFPAICRLSPRIRKFLFNSFFSFALLCRFFFHLMGGCCLSLLEMDEPRHWR